jgi:hypothetical protein
MAVRSTVLGRIRGSATSGSATIYTVPDGFTAIVKAAALSQWGGTQVALYIDVHAAAGQPSLHLIADSPPSGTSAFWDGWCVLEPGDYIVAAWAGGPADFWVSGAELPDG